MGYFGNEYFEHNFRVLWPGFEIARPDLIYFTIILHRQKRNILLQQEQHGPKLSHQ